MVIIRNDELTVYTRRTLQRAHTLGALVGCPHDLRLVYRARMEATGPSIVLRAIERGLARQELYLSIADEPVPSYHSTLEVVDVQDTIIEQFTIPTAEAFTTWQTMIELEIVASECSRCGTPEACSAW